MNLNDKKIINAVSKKILSGDIQPWKVENILLQEYNVTYPKQYTLAIICRRKAIEKLTTHQLKYLEIPKKPYLMKWSCPKDGSIYHLEARDVDTLCSYCGSKLQPYGTGEDRYMPLAVNYVGGREEYYSYAGQINVFGDVTKTFTNLLAYGIGVGPFGISAGCYRINKFGERK
jgi:hypothetical protein